MPIYELRGDTIQEVEQTTFGAERVPERGHLQRLLRDQIEVVVPGAMVIKEEYGSWEDSKRRIDLLAVDKNGTLVVVELKRTEDGGAMELQALRYAAMVSSLTFEQAVEEFGAYLKFRGREDDAREILLLHFDEEDVEERFAEEVRIVLVSADFSKELTTSVMWLSQKGIDIRCVRLRPHKLDDRVLLDIQQVLPLPEAADYQVRIRDKRQRERIARTSGKDFTKYTVTVDGVVSEPLNKRYAALRAFTALIKKGASTDDLARAIERPQMFFVVNGNVSGDEVRRAIVAQHSEDRANRYFTQDESIIHVNGQTLALGNNWGGNIAEQVALASAAVRIEGVICAPAEE